MFSPFIPILSSRVEPTYGAQAINAGTCSSPCVYLYAVSFQTCKVESNWMESNTIIKLGLMQLYNGLFRNLTPLDNG